MWLFTPDGFFSAVEHIDDPDKIMIRCRARIHAQTLVDACPEDSKPELVETPPPADYRYMVTITRETWVYVVASFAAQIAYPNFKDEASKRKHPPGFMGALHRVWSDLLSFQDSMHDDTRKSRWGFLDSLHGHGETRPLGGLNDQLAPHGVTGNGDGSAASDDDVEYVTLVEGMIVQMSGDPEMGEGEVVGVNNTRGTALVHFRTVLDDGEVEQDVLNVPAGDLVVVYDPFEDVLEEHLEEWDDTVSSRPEAETYDTIDEVAAADDGSWPPPALKGSLRGA